MTPLREVATIPTFPPPPPRPDRHLVRPYYRAWECEREQHRFDHGGFGLGGLQRVPRPRPPSDADLGDLTAAIRAWQVMTGART